VGRLHVAARVPPATKQGNLGTMLGGRARLDPPLTDSLAATRDVTINGRTREGADRAGDPVVSAHGHRDAGVGCTGALREAAGTSGARI